MFACAAENPQSTWYTGARLINRENYPADTRSSPCIRLFSAQNAVILPLVSEYNIEKLSDGLICPP